jgi:hypothetical protein
MGTVLSGLSLLMALALAGLLIASSRANARRIADARAGGSARRGTSGYYTSLGYAFNFTFAAAMFLAAGLSGYHLTKSAAMRWSDDVIWWEVLMGLPLACVAVYFWRKGLRDLRSDVYVPELAGRDAAAAPPSRRIERR